MINLVLYESLNPVAGMRSEWQVVCVASSLIDYLSDLVLFNRFIQKPPWPWLAITSSFGTLVIALLIGHIVHATVTRIAKVEDDYQKMTELKKRAEDADVAKSQVISFTAHNGFMCYCYSS